MSTAALPIPRSPLRLSRGRLAAAAVAIGLSIVLNSLPLAWRWGGVVVNGSPRPARPEPLQTRLIAAPTSNAPMPAEAEAERPLPPLPVLAESPPLRERPAPAQTPASAWPRPTAPPSDPPATARTDALPAAEPAAPPGYLKSSELSRSAQPLGEIVPDYPADATRRPGVVTLQLYIDEHGRVERADVLGAEPPGVFDAAAQAAFLKARFEPARLGNRAVRSQMTIEVEFKPADRNTSTSTRGY